MSATTFEQDDDPTGSIALCYALFGADEARAIACKVPRAPNQPIRNDDNDDPSDLYLA